MASGDDMALIILSLKQWTDELTFILTRLQEYQYYIKDILYSHIYSSLQVAILFIMRRLNTRIFLYQYSST